jgi:hypothetical protein
MKCEIYISIYLYVHSSWLYREKEKGIIITYTVGYIGSVKMSQLQVNFGKTLWCPRSLKFFFLKPDHSIFVCLHFWLLIFLNFQTFGHGIDFCYDVSKEGRLSFDDLRLILSLRPAARATYTPEMECQSSEGKVYIELYGQLRQ